MLAGPEAMRFLVDGRPGGNSSHQAGVAWSARPSSAGSQDVKVKLKRQSSTNDDLEDLFVDVKAHATAVLAVDRARDRTQSFNDPKAVGAVEYWCPRTSRSPGAG